MQSIEYQEESGKSWTQSVQSEIELSAHVGDLPMKVSSGNIAEATTPAYPRLDSEPAQR